MTLVRTEYRLFNIKTALQQLLEHGLNDVLKKQKSIKSVSLNRANFMSLTSKHCRKFGGNQLLLSGIWI